MKLAVIGTFYGRHENALPLMHRLFVDGTRKPDEAWLMCESQEDSAALIGALEELYELEVLDGWPEGAQVEVLPTPRDDVGNYAVIPYSNKINWALDHSEADAIVYLDNGSMPAPEKYELMLAALEEHPDWGAVYCAQSRTGWNTQVAPALEIVHDGFCVVNYTQVMHRPTADRWSLDMALADPDLADAWFWRALHQSLGPFHPVAGRRVLDEHHMPSIAAQGL